MDEGSLLISAPELNAPLGAGTSRKVKAAAPGCRRVSILWRSFQRHSDRTRKIADAPAHEAPEARTARIHADVDAVFEAPHPEEFRFDSRVGGEMS